jgi:brefeldin A-resistance guanine nucleotide exchange factor 1
LVHDERDHAQVEEIFNNVIFPLLDELLKPHVQQFDSQGMSETRLRASVLLCKAFMHFEVRDNHTKADIRVLWIEILDLLDRLIKAEKTEQLVSLLSMLHVFLLLMGIPSTRPFRNLSRKTNVKSNNVHYGQPRRLG